jgi:hypothetical protein
MEDRIQINGVWYIRENQTEDYDYDYDYDIESDVIHSESYQLETDNYRWEATRLLRTDGSFLDDFYILFTDKKVSLHNDDIWDNIPFMKGILKNNPDSLKALKESLNSNGIKDFKAFLKYLKEKEWL